MGATTFMIVLFAALAACVAYDLGKRMGHKDSMPEVDRCYRYRRAVDDLDRWCGHESPQARLIAAHLRAVGEGHSLNAGTPMADEPCTVNGLRDQLRRLKA